MAGAKRKNKTKGVQPEPGPAGSALSVCLIVRDGAATLARALESVRPIAEEIVVADTGSADAGPDICRAAGARVFQIPWRDDFAAARNAALERASGDWVLVLDADETIARPDLEALRRALGRKDVDGYRLLSRNYTDQVHGGGFTPCAGEYPEFEADPSGRPVPGWYPTYKVRLFRRKPGIRFRGRVHEMVDEAILESGGKIADLAVPVHHYGVLDPEVRRAKGLRYLQLGEAKVAEAPDDPRAWFELGVQAFETGDLDRSRRAFERTLALVEQGRAEAVRRFQALDYRPDLAHVMLGVVAERRGDPAAAAERYRAALEMNPRAHEAHMNLGVLLEGRGDLQAAREHFRRAAALQPRNPRARQCLDRVRSKTGGRAQRGARPSDPSGDRLPRISLCMIVRDEAEALPRCLESVRGVVSEAIVVDTGSSDGTQEAARRLGARVIEIPWPEDFSAARNHGLRAAAGEWILVLDADEEIAPEDRRALLALAGGEADAYRFVTRNYVFSSSFSHFRAAHPGDPMARGAAGWFPSRKVRLFRRHPEVRFEGAVHEVVDRRLERLGWETAEADVPVHHYGLLRADDERRRKKRERYRLLAEKKAGGGEDPQALYEIGIHAGESGDHEGAVGALQRALDLAPDFPARYPSLTNPHALLGANLLRLGRAEEALRALERGRGLAPGNADVLHFLGLARHERGETGGAIEALREAVARSPHLAAAHRNLGVVLRDAGRPEEAKAHFERALALDPGQWERRRSPGRPAPGAALSLCMIVRDEAENVGQCLDCVRDIVEEMVIVDTGSTDGTPEVAGRRGARVFSFPWCDDFSAARNESLRRAAGDYVLWLDADDRLDEENRAALKALKGSLPPGRDAAFTFTLSNRRGGREMDRCRQMRLFPRLEGVAFEGRVHEQVTYSLRRLGVRTVEAGVRVDHLGYPDPEGLRRKAERNVRLMRMEARERPENWANRFHLACALALLGDLEGAYRENRWVVQESRCPAESPEWHYNALLHLARLCQARGDLGEALAALDRAAALRPEDGFLWFSRGEFLLAAGRPADALRALAKAEGRPIEPGAFPLPVPRVRLLIKTYRARAAERMSRTAEAEAICREALAEFPGEREAAVALAGLLLRTGRLGEARAFYERALGLEEGDAAAWCNLGLCLARQGEAERAEASFHKALELDAGLAAAWLNLGHFYRERGLAEPAALALGRAAELDPRSVSARLGLAVLFVQAGDALKAAGWGVSALEALGVGGPRALEDWGDLVAVFELLAARLEEAGRCAEASLAEAAGARLNTFRPEEGETSDGMSGTPGGAFHAVAEAAVSVAPEENGGAPGGNTPIESDST